MDNSQSKTVVVVNDTPVDLLFISSVIKKEGYHVLSFSSVEEALKAMSPQSPPHLVVTDLYMPDIDGWKFCRLLRSPEYKHYNHIPIVVVSATYSGDYPEEITANVGANAFVPIPLDPPRFRETLRYLLAGQATPSTRQVLIIEDSRIIIKIIQPHFENNGFNVFAAMTGEAGRGLFYQHHPEIVIIDYHLPDLLGDQLLGEFKRARPQTVIVMITANASPHLATQFMRQGAAAYVRKPFDPAYLTSLCDHACRERALLRVEEILEARTKELRESEQRFRQLYLSMNDHCVLYELIRDQLGRPIDYCFRDANPAFLRSADKSLNEVVGRLASEFFGPGSAPHLGHYSQAVSSGALTTFEAYIPLFGRHYRFNAFPSTQNHFFSVAVDISDQKKVEEDLKFSERRYEDLFNTINDFVYIHDWDGRLITVNQAMADRLGYRPEKFKGLMITDFIPPKYQHVTYSDYRERIKAKGHFDGTIILIDGQGQQFFVEFRSVLREYPNGETLIVGVGRDITERKNAEAERERLISALKVLNMEVQHRVKNNFQVLISLLNMQVRKEQDSWKKSSLQEIQGRIRTMALVNEELQRGKHLAKVDLGQYAEKLSKTIFESASWRRAGLSLVFRASPGMTTGPAQAFHIGLILNELITNSIKYGFSEGQTGEITVSLNALEHGKLELVVGDNGIGLPPRLDWTRSDSLGLPLVKLLTETQLHGTMEIIPGPGTRFRIVF